MESISARKRIKKRWIILFALTAFISVLGLFVSPREGNFDLPNDNIYANVAWMITATIFVLMMTPGLSFFYGGMVRAKNVISTMLQSFIVMGVVSVIWVVFGFGLAFGDDWLHIIGNPVDFFMFNNVGVQNVTAAESERIATEVGGSIGLATTTIPLALFALFQMKFAIITPSLITGSFAERVRFSGYLIFMILWVILVYCPLAHVTWHPDGLLAQCTCMISPVVSWCMQPRALRLLPEHSSSASAPAPRIPSQPMCHSCSSAQPCCGWDGSDSTAAALSQLTEWRYQHSSTPTPQLRQPW